jgi:Glu-tRNA(Gln) amidotransferase subunit E-like FAD-binding protein
MQNANELLKNAYPFKEDELEDVLKFYQSKNFAKETILTWTETLDYIKKNPNVTIEEILESKGLPANHLDEPTEVFKKKD